MTIDITPWETDNNEHDRVLSLEFLRNSKFALVDKTVNDLLAYAIGLGFTPTQARSSVEDLFRTYLNSWLLYLFIGADDILTDIQNDATLGWLDTDVAGSSIRQRLINRLS